MMKTTKRVLSGILWLGRGTATMMGLVIILALMLGVTTRAVFAATADTAEAGEEMDKKIVFTSDRTSGTGVNNPTGDVEIFVMDPDGTELQQLTFNTVTDFSPTLSPDGEKIAFVSAGAQTSNLQGDFEIYLMNSLDGSDQQNLTTTNGDIDDFGPDFSPDGEKIAYSSEGVRSSNAEGDSEVYKMNDDGSAQNNLTDTADGIFDFEPDFSSNGEKIAYRSLGVHSSRNPEGDDEIYKMNDDGSAQENLTDTGSEVTDIEPDFGMAKK
jgi:Tol biopolymer transport system component